MLWRTHYFPNGMHVGVGNNAYELTEGLKCINLGGDLFWSPNWWICSAGNGVRIEGVGARVRTGFQDSEDVMTCGAWYSSYDSDLSKRLWDE